MSRTGKYIGGSTIIHTGNYGGPAREAAANASQTSPPAKPRDGGAATNLTEHKEYIGARLKRKRQAAKSAKRATEIKKWRIAVAELEANISDLEGRLEKSLVQLNETHDHVQKLIEKLKKRKSQLKRYRRKLNHSISSELESSKARFQNNKQRDNGANQNIESK